MILQAEPKVYAPNKWLEEVIKVRKQNAFKKWLFVRKLDRQFHNISPSGTFMHMMAETIELAGMYFMYNNDKENSPIASDTFKKAFNIYLNDNTYSIRINVKNDDTFEMTIKSNLRQVAQYKWSDDEPLELNMYKEELFDRVIECMCQRFKKLLISLIKPQN